METITQELANTRNELTIAMRKKLAESYKEIAVSAIARFEPDVATNLFTCFTQYLIVDNESRIGVCVGTVGTTGDIAVTLRGMTRAGPFWGDFIKHSGGTEVTGKCDGHQTMNVVELAALLACAKLAIAVLVTAFPSDAVTATV